MYNGLLSHKLDFEILPSSNSKILIFLDESEYFELPELPLLKIVPPGYSKFFQVNVDASKINVLNSNLIGYTNVLESDCVRDLPDGIWHFTYMICPYEYLWVDKYHLRTNLLYKHLNDIYSHIECCSIVEMENSKIKQDLIDIHILIESAKANTEVQNLKNANKDFSLAQKKVKRLLEKIDKVNV